MTTWRKEIECEMQKQGETWADVVGCTLDATGLDAGFDNGYGSPAGALFTLWTAQRVYFPATYDGAEWVASVPRNPCDEATDHVGS
jgi:hypothetical protein